MAYKGLDRDLESALDDLAVAKAETEYQTIDKHTIRSNIEKAETKIRDVLRKIRKRAKPAS